ncbi:unnamed protein product [Chironomus riparius]|uniref:ZAD domain-containing protein n=1 Tax=Chironomus riparius TaxID=315576 RepID=A0A9N9RT58_9DIPT|nr:unnamed protein product [Chironomus riparius]
MVNNDMCRFCLDSTEEKTFYPLDLEMSILEMGSGTKVTIGDALKYIEMDVMIPSNETKTQKSEQSEAEDTEEESNEKASEEEVDHPDLPKSLCQECLDKLQSIYEFKYRVLENREYLKGYIKELAEARLAEEKAARQAIAQELDIDLNNLDNLPDKLVLRKDVSKTRRPRKPRDPSEPGKPRQKRRVPDKNIIIADDSQVDTAIYVRKVVVTPEKASPDQKHSNKRKSKHVVIEDIAVGEKPKPPKYDRHIKKKEPLCDENNLNKSNSGENETETLEAAKEAPRKERRDDEPIFEDDEDFEKEKRPKRQRK